MARIFTDDELDSMKAAFTAVIRQTVLDEGDSIRFAFHTNVCPTVLKDDPTLESECDCPVFVVPLDEAIRIGAERLAEKMGAALDGTHGAS